MWTTYIVVFKNDKVGEGDGGEDGRAVVMVLSDSPVQLRPRHEPGQDEEQLAALLMAKSLMDLKEMVPMTLDRDYPFFERVLQAHPEV